jgi:multidrug resistance protein, MATE family
LGLGLGLSTVVGQQLGQDRPDRAARATSTAFVMAAVYMGLMAAAYVAFPDALMIGQALGADPKQFAPVRTLTVILLRFVAAYCLFDVMNVVFAGTLKGAGDTKFILLTTAALLPLLIGGVAAGLALGGGILWCWVMITGWVCGFGLIYGVRFSQGRWRTMRVIEPDVAREEEESANW